MRVWVMIATALVATPAMAEQDRDASLNLICEGSASRDEASKPRLPWDTKRDKRVDYQDSVYLRLRTDNTGEAQLPKKMQSAYKEGKEGWFPLIGVTRDPNLIEGQIRLHAMYKPRFKIDRRTGLLTISGQLGDFSGKCEPYDPNAGSRKF